MSDKKPLKTSDKKRTELELMGFKLTFEAEPLDTEDSMNTMEIWKNQRKEGASTLYVHFTSTEAARCELYLTPEAMFPEEFSESHIVSQLRRRGFVSKNSKK
jgi:hypothetical protein